MNVEPHHSIDDLQFLYLSALIFNTDPVAL